MHRWVRVSGITVLGAVAAAVLACGGGATEPASPKATAKAKAAATTVNVELTEFAVKPDKPSAPAGAITFNAVNKGSTPHELVVVKSDLASDKLPTKDGKVDESAVQIVGETSEFAGGKSEAKTMTLTGGKYILICNIPAHYIAGMHISFFAE